MTDKLVLVLWKDAYGCSTDWTPLDNVQAQPLIAESVGWLVADNESCVTVVPHRTDGNNGCHPQGCGDMTIPKTSIIKIIELEVPE